MIVNIVSNIHDVVAPKIGSNIRNWFIGLKIKISVPIFP